MVSEFSNRSPDSMRAASLDEASELLRKAAGNRLAGESMKAVFRRVGRQLKGWSDSRIRDVWYRDKRVRIRAEEVEQLKSIAAPSGIETGDELAELRNRISRLERLLEVADAPFHSETLAALRHQRGQMGGKPGPVD